MTTNAISLPNFGYDSLMVRLIVLLFCAGVALPSSMALAQSEDVSEENEERARLLFQAGDEHYANGRYEDALAAFEESYALSGHPLLLFNMANAQERMGLYDGAISSLERYLPDAEEGETSRIETRLESLRARAERVRDMTATRSHRGAAGRARHQPRRPDSPRRGGRCAHRWPCPRASGRERTRRTG